MISNDSSRSRSHGLDMIANLLRVLGIVGNVRIHESINQLDYISITYWIHLVRHKCDIGRAYGKARKQLITIAFGRMHSFGPRSTIRKDLLYKTLKFVRLVLKWSGEGRGWSWKIPRDITGHSCAKS